MSHIALYREWRPQTFSEVVAQNQVIFPLKQSIINGEIGHAYLFSGTRGTGKTSTAKIFAKAINCLHPQNGDPCNECEICQGINDGSLLDVMEIDAASNNSVDNIRRITEEIVFMPTRARYKVYIIDEVHMLSSGAFNALLKTLEEPPAHAIFILATTEPHRIPATVISRCLRFDFKRIPQDEIIDNLKKIAEHNSLEIEDAALSVIAQLSDGAMRDAISLLDQAKSGITAPITRQKLLDMIGIVQDQFMLLLFEAILHHNLKEVLNLINQMVMSGKDLERFVTKFAQFLRNILITKVTGNTDDWFGFNEHDLEKSLSLMKLISTETVLQWIEQIAKLSAELKYAGDVRIAIEIGLIRLMNSDIQIAEAIKYKTDEVPKLNHSAEKSTVAEKAEHNQATKPSQTTEPSQTAEPNQTAAPKPEPKKTAEAIQESKEDRRELDDSKQKTSSDEPVNHIVEAKNTNSSDSQKTWDKALDYLVKLHRIDLKMLLSPAMVTCQDSTWEITFNNDLKGHYKTIATEANQNLIREALQEVTDNPALKLTVHLSDHIKNNEENLNDEEPAWIKEVRKLAKDLDIPMMMEE